MARQSEFGRTGDYLISTPNYARDEIVNLLMDPINKTWDYDKLRNCLPPQAVIRACQYQLATSVQQIIFYAHIRRMQLTQSKYAIM